MNMRTSLRIYSWLLRLYPARFRQQFGDALELEFEEAYAEARHPVLFWLAILADILRTLPAQLSREFFQDAAHALRLYRRQPLFAILAISALAIGIGATAGVYSFLDATLLKPLPFAAPERLAVLHQFPTLVPGQSKARFDAWRRDSRYLSDAVLYAAQEANLEAGNRGARIAIAEVSANFFAMLGAKPAWGRTFSSQDDTPGHNDLAVISHTLWQQHFGGDPAAIGATIRINGLPLTITGVAPENFDYPSRTQVWTPTVFEPLKLQKAGAHFLIAIGQLREGLSVEAAQPLFQQEAVKLAPQITLRMGDQRPTLIPLARHLSAAQREPAWILLAAVLSVLLIGCANIVNLILGRMIGRQKEMHIRAAIGANRARLVQQLLTEGLVLAIAGGLAGMLIAIWTVRMLTAFLPPSLTAQEPSLNLRVFLAGLALSLTAGLLFGIIPLWQRQSAILRRALIGIQVALCLVLLTGGVTLSLALYSLLHTDLGFRTNDVLTVRVSLLGTAHEKTSANYYNAVLERLRALPGVQHAGGAAYIPLTRDPFSIFRVTASRDRNATAMLVSVTPGYLESMGAQVIAGSLFTRDEGQIIVNEPFARKLGTPAELIGTNLETLRINGTVAGVVRSMKYWGPGSNEFPTIYVPEKNFSWPYLTFTILPTHKDAVAITTIRDAVAAIDPKVAVYDARSLSSRLEQVLARPRFHASAFTAFAAFALFLSLLGIYGVAISSVAQSKKEIAIRMAIGATASSVRAHFLRHAMRTVIAGALTGLLGCAALAKWLPSLVQTAQPLSPLTTAAIALSLVFAACLTVWFATSRIAATQPITILRTD